MSWTEERVEILKKLWMDGLSASQIASQCGVTRNAVIGKVHRLNLSGRAKPAAPTPRPKKTRPPAPTRPVRQPARLPAVKAAPAARRLDLTVPIERLVVPLGAKVPLLGLDEKMCRWPSGDPRDAGFGFCGHERFGLMSYCEYHARIAYTPDGLRRKSGAAA